MPATEPPFPDGAALVIGGSGGVGAGIVRALAEAGSPVVFTYRHNRDKAEALARELADTGVALHALPYRAGEALALREAVTNHAPRLHTLVNAAGSDIPMQFINAITPAEWRQVIDDDLNSVFDLLQAFLPLLRESRGSFVQISSVGLSRYMKQDILSVAPKAGVESLVRGIAREEGRDGVRANAVQLGVIDTGIFGRLKATHFSKAWVAAARDNTALKRFGHAKDVAHAVTFLASNRARYITGATLYLDGGFRL